MTYGCIESKVSIIIPVYNSAEHLEKCMTSVLGQSHKNIEIFLIDDGSTDNSLMLCQHFHEFDNRVHVLHQENSGQSVARNNALNQVTGDYIMFVDSDDWLDTEAIDKMLSAICSQSLDAVKCGTTFVGTKDSYHQNFDNPLTSEETFELILYDKIGNQLWGWLYKAEMWKNIRLPAGRVSEDAAVLPKVLLNKKISVTSGAFYNYNYSNPNNTSNVKENKLKNAVDRAIMFFERAEWLKSISYENKDLHSYLIKKAVGFSVGAIAIHKQYHHDKEDINYIISFLKKYKKQVLSAKNIDIFRKISVVTITISPSLFCLFARPLRSILKL